MPLFRYRCTSCEAELEVFQQTSDPDPRLCGFRCPLGPESGHADRGFGALERQLSAPARSVRASLRRDTPTAAEMHAAGFTAYKNEGTGLRKIAGDGPEPDWVPAKDPRE